MCDSISAITTVSESYYVSSSLNTKSAGAIPNSPGQQLPGLPEEIIDLVCSHINKIQDVDSNSSDGFDRTTERATLLSLFRASHTTYRIARPYLYRVLELETRKHGQRELLLALLKHPELAREVRQVRVIGRAWKIRPWDGNDKRARLTAKDKVTGLLAIRRLQTIPLRPTTRGDIWRGVEEGKEDAEIACIIAICPYIEALHLPGFPSLYQSQLQPVIGHTLLQTSAKNKNVDGSVPLPLSRLERLSFNTANSDDTHDGMMTFAEIGSMISLRRLQVLQANNIDLRGYNKGTQYGLSGLFTASLTNVWPNHNGIAMFLQRCPHLQVLRLHSINFYSEHGGMPLEDIGSSLNQYGTNLRDLELLAESIQQPRTGIVKALGCLTNLCSLQRLKVTDFLLSGRQRVRSTSRMAVDIDSFGTNLSSTLPKNLEQLEIEGTGSESQFPAYCDQIVGLISDSYHASLKRVRFPRYLHAVSDRLLENTDWRPAESAETEIVWMRSE